MNNQSEIDGSTPKRNAKEMETIDIDIGNIYREDSVESISPLKEKKQTDVDLWYSKCQSVTTSWTTCQIGKIRQKNK